jgi:predicted ester cyclase
MNKRETVQAFMDSIQQGDLDNAKSMLADDFTYSGSVPEPMNKADWLEMSKGMKKSFPDLNYHFKVIGTKGDVVKSTMQLSGTHREAFDLTKIEMGMIHATNKTFSVKVEKLKLTVKDEKISTWVVEPNDGAGLDIIVKQLQS